MKPDFETAARDTADKKYLPLSNMNDNNAPVHSRNFVFDTNKGSFIYGFLAGCEHAYSLPKWISVNDRLPEEHVNVLVLLEGGSRLLGVMDSNLQWFVFWRDGIDREDPNRLVTHWQPLPETPKP